jgi:DNA end-binding protein Ku
VVRAFRIFNVLEEVLMRAIWSGEIAFGLVTIPTKLYSGTRDLTPKFHLVHKNCGTRVQMVRRCPKHHKDLAWDEIEKAYEVSKGEYAHFTKEELAEATADEPKGMIEIVEFIEPDEVDLAYIENSYWVGPSGKTAHSFTLLRTVLEKTGRVAVAKVAIRTRTRLALLRPREHLFSLDMMRFADELVPSKEIEIPIAKAPSEKELKLAKSLVDQLAASFDPEKHPDEYRARVSAMVDEKVEKHETAGGDVDEGGKKKRTGAQVIDLSALLMRSLKGKAKPGPAKSGHRGGVHRAAGSRRAAG